MKKALYFGSFNPLHIGHMAIANYITEFCDAQAVYFIPTPVNPLKRGNPGTLGENFSKRLEDLRAAVKKSGLNIIVSDIEAGMEPPYYTVNTLRALSLAEPDTDFVLVMGADNLSLLEKWYRYDEILSHHEIWVFPRAGYEIDALVDRYNAAGAKGVKKINAPIIEVSSTLIREGEAEGKNMNGFRYF